ncbi:MAG: methionine adenosyltransferase [Verrucomicrobiales bacterium]|jgi:S-adenosylmethionine synthetase|nr:methionine adenosyltransferase [Verrucomicrobiales bacterium]MDP4638670.1 methionine adenosyltransferase [Verrucomicrobiales bacterium]MDP4793424.1 methionine adenosyltransferase [Verrucomicrobiales bacterium]MDP4939622.1 methionine adenosyltransferase [Verrucomicrobiales bacterium]MDP5004229.1 methionine adenosyltransferase [Verrucomicrobiales bacterium]
MANSYIFSSESVTEGHPDKVCDTISDSIVDACFEQDTASRVACETMVKDNIVVLGGEITTGAKFDYREVVKAAMVEIGYTNADCKFNADTFFLLNAIGQQSPDIAQGVDAAAAEGKETAEQGAGDQGIMFGYAVRETPSLMPAPIAYSHQLGRTITDLRKSGKHTWLRPDSKTQVSMEYVDGKPTRVTAVVVSTQHSADITTAEIREILKKELIEAVIPGELLTPETEYHINPTGLFIIGGPEGDCGLTGRKIIVDTYGGMGRHGGGAFSGKDPSKVDRSAAYMARYVAKNVVAAGLAERCELQLAYAIGYPQPVSVHVDTFGTNQVDDAKIIKAIKEIFSFKPADFIRDLNLLRPIYRKTTNYGHFGREDDTDSLTWEKTDKAEALKSACA